MMKTDQSDASARQRVLKAADNPTELEEIRKDSLQVSEGEYRTTYTLISES